MGTPKLSLELSSGRKLGAVALEELARCEELSPLVVVVRADDPLGWLPPAGNWRVETCFTASLGFSFSLRCGLNAVLPYNPDAVLVTLADQPFIRAESVKRLIDAFRKQPDLDYAASGNNGAGMPPVLFSKTMVPVLERLEGDRGARGIFESPDYRGITIDVESPEYFMDADTEQDFQHIQNHWIKKSKLS